MLTTYLVLRPSYILFHLYHLIFTTIFWGRYYYSHFINNHLRFSEFKKLFKVTKLVSPHSHSFHSTALVPRQMMYAQTTCVYTYTHSLPMFLFRPIVFISRNNTLIFVIQFMSHLWDNLLIGVSEHHSINIYWNELGIPTSWHPNRYSWTRDQNVKREKVLKMSQIPS